MRRKPLFPPPEETAIDPVTKRPVTKRLANQGRQSTYVLTINGRIVLKRRWWHSASEGSAAHAPRVTSEHFSDGSAPKNNFSDQVIQASPAPADVLIDRPSQTVTDGVVEMASRLNNDGTSFDAAAENLFRTAQIKMSGEQLRQRVIAAGHSVLAAQRCGVRRGV